MGMHNQEGSLVTTQPRVGSVLQAILHLPQTPDLFPNRVVGSINPINSMEQVPHLALGNHFSYSTTKGTAAISPA